MYVTTEITIDFQRPRQNTMQVVQDDTTRKIRLILKNGGNDYDIASDLGSEETWVGAVAYLKPDGHGGVYDTTKDGEKAVQLVSGTTNQFDVLLVGQVFTAAGWTQVNVKFYNADFSKVLSTFAIDVNVQRNAASDYESEDYSNMQSLGAIRAEMVAFEANTKKDIALEYNPAGTYRVGEIRYHDGNLYTCVVTIDVPEEWTSAHWLPVNTIANILRGMVVRTDVSQTWVSGEAKAKGRANIGAASVDDLNNYLAKHNPAATGTLTLTNNNNMLFFEAGSRTLSLFGDGHSGTVELGNLTSPNNNSSAATKGYVDAKIAALEARIAALEV